MRGIYPRNCFNVFCGRVCAGYAPGADVVLCWDTWVDASVDAGISRLMGGIHIIADHIDGEIMGFGIADMVYYKALRLWH